jgi:pseudouridine synthase
VRINQFVAQASGLSRRAADTAISSGRVTVNGATAAVGVDISGSEAITFDGQPLRLPATHTYVLLNKPTGFVSSRARQGVTPTLYELLPHEFSSLRIAGRLDADSSGLILLTDDGPLIQQITHPSAGKSKEYHLTLTRALTPTELSRLQGGIDMDDGPSHVTVTAQTGRRVTVTLGEGRNRQLRRTFGALGNPILQLHRTRLGGFELGALRSGKWLLISKEGAPL